MREPSETTPQDHAEEEQGAAERSGPRGPHHPRPRSQPPQAADGRDAQETPLGRAAGEQRGERQAQLEARCVAMTPRSNDGAPSPRRPASEGDAPLRTALDALSCRGHSRPVAHVAHGHLWSSAPAIAGEMGSAGAGGQEIGPCDEDSRAAGALTAAANAQTGTDGERRGERAIGDVSNGDRANGDDATDGLETGSSTPPGEVNVASRANAAPEVIEARRDAHGGSAARRHAPPSNGDEANAPGALQPLRRSVQRTPDARGRTRRRKGTWSEFAHRGTSAIKASKRIRSIDGRMAHDQQAAVAAEEEQQTEEGEQLDAAGELEEEDKKTCTSKRDGGL
ncbi:unnamed protein product [Closterium sp. Naga37s-1]|nr:unnamed protein product [Closterium sp. Naga37s-1]